MLIKINYLYVLNRLEIERLLIDVLKWCKSNKAEAIPMSFLHKKNKASFVFFIITLYSCIGFSLGYIIWEYVLQ